MFRLRRWITAVLLALCCMSAAAVTAQAAQTVTVKLKKGTYCYDKAFELLRKVNVQRVNKGRPTLQMDRTMLDLAMKRAAEYSVRTESVRPNGKSCLTISKKVSAENAVCGKKSMSEVSEVLEDWAADSSKKKNMMNSKYVATGIGCFKQGNAYYWVQLFGTKKGTSAECPANKTVAPKVTVLKKLAGRENGLGLTSIDDGSVTSSKKLTVKLSKKSYTYDGTEKLPDVTVCLDGRKISDYTVSRSNFTNVGLSTVKVEGKGEYSGCKGSATFRINLKKASLKGTASPKAGQLKVSFKPDPQSDGCEVQYNLKSSFKGRGDTERIIGNDRSSAVMEGLQSGKTYYVRVRTYRRVNGEDWYSEWSSVKKQKVR